MQEFEFELLYDPSLIAIQSC